MIDLKFLRENPDLVKENIKKKFQDHKLVLVDEVIEYDKKAREAQWEARKTMARLEQIAAQEYGFEYADDLHERELGGKRV